MALDEKRVVQVFLILLKQELNIQKAFDAGYKIVTGMGGTYSGLTVWTLANPPRDKHCLSFTIEPDKLGLTVGKIADELGLVMGMDCVVHASPTVQLIPKPRPPQTAA